MHSVHREQVAYAARLQHVEKTFTAADLTAMAMTQQLDFDAALPDDAFVLGADINVTVAFTDGAAGTFKGDVGFDTTDTDGLIAGAANNLETIARLGSPIGVLAPSFAGGELPCLLVTSSVNVDTATAGSVTVRIYFYAADQAGGQDR